MISIIVAMQKNRGIGFEGHLPWRIPEDLARFKKLTAGHPVVMGRKTWDSIPVKFRPLPERTNIVLTHDPAWQSEGAVAARSIEEAFTFGSRSPGWESMWVIGGNAVYEAALPFVDELWLTLVDADEPADAFFPEGYEAQFPEEISREPFTSSSGVRATYLRLGR